MGLPKSQIEHGIGRRRLVRAVSRRGTRLAWVMLSASGLILACMAYLVFLIAPFGPPNEVSIRIERGLSSESIGELLATRGVVRSSALFGVVARAVGVEGRLRAGDYRLSSRMGLPGIVRILAEGRVELVELTVPEGFTVKEIAELLDAKGLAARDRFIALARGEVGSFRPSVSGIDLPRNLEGYLFPDTYKVESGTSEESIIHVMVQRFAQVVLPEFSRDDVAETPRKLGLHSVVTVASIVEEEARLRGDRPLVAAVFYNRLSRNLPLQSCATVQFALGARKERLSYDDLKVESPYNTYLVPGLPPGPIASPGLSSIRAALCPAPVDYLYFAADEKGGHIFSRTFGQHQRALVLLRGKE